MNFKFNLPLQKGSAKSIQPTPDHNGLIDSKYTAHHISYFHQVTLALVSDQKVNPVAMADQQHLVAFSKLMISLFKGPDIWYGVPGKIYPQGKYFTLHPPGESPVLSLSVAFKKKLINWMGDVVAKEDISMEDVLDSFYAVFNLPRKRKVIDRPVTNNGFITNLEVENYKPSTYLLNQSQTKK